MSEHQHESVAQQTNQTNAGAVSGATKIHANYNNLVSKKEMKFSFKKNALGDKRATVVLELAVPSVEGIVSIIESGGKGLDLLLETVSDVIAGQARGYVNEKEDINQENFPHDKILWDAIANQPKAERRGAGIAKEAWEAFAADYINVMPGAAGKSAEQVANAAKLFVNKFNLIRTDKGIIGKLKIQLGIYVEHSPNVEEHTEVVEYLLNKAETLLAADNAALLDNL